MSLGDISVNSFLSYFYQPVMELDNFSPLKAYLYILFPNGTNVERKEVTVNGNVITLLAEGNPTIITNGGNYITSGIVGEFIIYHLRSELNFYKVIPSSLIVQSRDAAFGIFGPLDREVKLENWFGDIDIDLAEEYPSTLSHNQLLTRILDHSEITFVYFNNKMYRIIYSIDLNKVTISREGSNFSFTFLIDGDLTLTRIVYDLPHVSIYITEDNVSVVY